MQADSLIQHPVSSRPFWGLVSALPYAILALRRARQSAAFTAQTSAPGFQNFPGKNMDIFLAVGISMAMFVVGGVVVLLAGTLLKKEAQEKRPAGDPVILSHQLQILSDLAVLPQFVILKDGGLFDLLSGSRLAPTEYKNEPPYLALEAPHMLHGLLFSSTYALDRYLGFQRQVAQRFTENVGQN